KKLPPDRRKPGAVKIEDDPETDDQFYRTMPKGAQAFEVFTRLMEKTDFGLKQAVCTKGKGDQPGRDHFWLTKQELADLADPNAKPGVTKPLPKFVQMRIARFHLLDDTRGEPPMWDEKEVRK